ncbi:hypothetical protein DICVIV_13116 [Dictyocaulus viviparus]|uniref:Uncharacterized protein n=1 Tax=Dictyocaulus viviparus TaxID=29172 RepID=A0A0D8XB92_DICVI|nr:hypothetical protein DICVIV_13116 [Dictyocaulus viviparus]
MQHAAINALNIRNAHYYINPFLTVTSLIDALYIFDKFQMIAAYWYSLVITLTSICNKVLRFQIAISAVVEMNVSLAEKSSSIIVVITVVAVALIGELFATAENGYNRSVSIMLAVIPITSNIIVIIELFVIGVFYGFRLIFSNMSLMMVDVTNIETRRGRLLANTIITILWAAVIPFATVMHGQYSTGCSISSLFKRNPDLWGPRLRSNRTEADRAERMIRNWW